MPCSELYFTLHRYAEHIKLEKEFKKRLKKVLRKYGYSTKWRDYKGR
jgi:hypothetical protein